MNKLMFGGIMPRYMAEAGGDGGEGGGSGDGGATATTTTTGEGEAKTGEGETKTGEGETAKTEYTDEDFTKAMVASDAVKRAAGDEHIELSPELVKGMLPTIRKMNLTPDQANELANELASQQIAAARAHAEARAADIKKMNDEAYATYTDKQSWEMIGAGVKHFFKPGGVMFETIVNSELGSDKEFLALMKWVGERVQKDNLGGGGGGSGGDKSVSFEKALFS